MKKFREQKGIVNRHISTALNELINISGAVKKTDVDNLSDDVIERFLDTVEEIEASLYQLDWFFDESTDVVGFGKERRNCEGHILELKAIFLAKPQSKPFLSLIKIEQLLKLATEDMCRTFDPPKKVA